MRAIAVHCTRCLSEPGEVCRGTHMGAYRALHTERHRLAAALSTAATTPQKDDDHDDHDDRPDHDG